MLRIVLVRPGMTDYDQQGRIMGTLDVPLCQEGCDTVAALVDQIQAYGMDLIYTSPSESAAQTADTLAAALNVKTKVLSQLRNINHGLWQGMLIDDVKRKQPKVYKMWQEQPEAVCPPEGEMLSGARQRAERAVIKLLKKHAAGTIGLVVPEPLASLLASILRQTDLKNVWNHNHAAGSWEVIEIQPPALTTVS